MKAIKYHFIG